VEEIKPAQLNFAITKKDTRDDINQKLSNMRESCANGDFVHLILDRNTIGQQFVTQFEGITFAKITVTPGAKLFKESLSILIGLSNKLAAVQLEGCRNLDDIEVIEVLSNTQVQSAVLPSGHVLSTPLAIRQNTWLLDETKNYESPKVVERKVGSHSAGIWRIKALSNGSFVTASYDCSAKVWQLGSNKPSALLKDHEGEVLCVEELPDGRLLTGSHDGKLRLWDLEDSSCVATMKSHEHGVYSIGTLSSSRVATGACDYPTIGHHLDRFGPNPTRWKYDICIWDLEKKGVTANLQGHEGAISALLGEGHQVVSCSADQTVRIWDVETEKALQIQGDHEDYVYALTRTAAGRIASGSRDQSIILWDPRENRTRMLDSHDSTVYDVTPLPQHQLASASRDKSVRIWDLRNYKTAVATLEIKDRYAYSIDRLPTGELVAGLSGSKHKPAFVQVWKFPEREDITEKN
jgi:WD40 repeat protein